MWKNKNVWIVMLGEGIAGLGLWFGIIGNLEFLQQTVPSDFLKALILMTGLFVGVLIAPMAGRIIDQSYKKKVMIYSGFLRVISVLFMFIAIETGSVWWMVCFAILIQISAAFYFPALQSIIPMVVKDHQLLAVNGLHMNVATFSRIIGTALAGFMLLSMSLFSLYLCSIIAYAILLVFTFFLQVDESLPAKAMTSEVHKKNGFKEVFPVITSSPLILMTLILSLVPMFFIGSFNLMVIKISEMQADPTIKGLLYMTEGIAVMLGAYIAKKLASGRNIIPFLLGSTFLIALSQFSLYFADIKLASIASFALFGFAVGSFFPLGATLFQKQVSKEYHGRFFSFRGMMDRVLFQIILLATGLFLDTIGFKLMVVSFATCSFLIVAFYVLKQYKQPAIFIDTDTVPVK